MKTFTQRNSPEETGTLNRLMFIVLLMGSLLAPLPKHPMRMTAFNTTPCSTRARLS